MNDATCDERRSSEGGDEDFLLGGGSRAGSALRRHRGNKHFIWLSALTAIALFCLSLSVFFIFQSWALYSESRAQLVLGEEEIWSDVPFVKSFFDRSKVFRSTGPEGDRAWEQLLPIGDGYIKVSDPRRYDLQPSVHLHDWDPRIKSDDPTAEVYSVAVAHQLHCLALLRAKLLSLTRVSARRGMGDDHIGHEDVSHLVHCLDYLRQSITCCGDTTLEGGLPTYGSDGKVNDTIFSGRWTTHKCRSWEAIRATMAERRASDFGHSIFD